MLEKKFEPELTVSKMRSYAYAANALGTFIKTLQRKKLLAETLVVATGDHGSRFHYSTDGWWTQIYGVPIIFWIPSEEIKKNANIEEWVSHLDIFPTLKSLVLHKNDDPLYRETIFSKSRSPGALTFNSFGSGDGSVVSDAGAVDLYPKTKSRCYSWTKDPGNGKLKLVPNINAECTEEQTKMAKMATARRTLMDLSISKEIMPSNSGTKDLFVKEEIKK